MTKTVQSLHGHHLLSIVGQQGTGKSTISKLIADKLGAQHIETSEVVRHLCGDIPRSDMYKTNVRTKYNHGWLGEAVIERINRHKVVISGVREEEVHDTFRRNHANLTIMGLWCPQQERYGRVRANSKVNTYADFIKHDQSELDIGLRELLKLYPAYPSSYIAEEQLAVMIIKRLHKGWTE